MREVRNECKSSDSQSWALLAALYCHPLMGFSWTHPYSHCSDKSPTFTMELIHPPWLYWSHSSLSSYSINTLSHTAVPPNIFLFLVGNPHEDTGGSWRAGTRYLALFLCFRLLLGTKKAALKTSSVAESSLNVTWLFLPTYAGYIKDLLLPEKAIPLIKVAQLLYHRAVIPSIWASEFKRYSTQV